MPLVAISAVTGRNMSSWPEAIEFDSIHVHVRLPTQRYGAVTVTVKVVVDAIAAAAVVFVKSV